MSFVTIEADQTEEILGQDVSDEALEAAAGTCNDAGRYTLFLCTALDLCPGP